MSEANLMRKIMVRLSSMGWRVFRNNIGMAWRGSPSFYLKRGQVYKAKGGEMVIVNPVPIHYGLCEGSGDIIGWKPYTVTEADVGRKIAIFVSPEVKKRTKPSPEQIKFRDAVLAAGGVAFLVDDENLTYKGEPCSL